ncbi:MAG: hypothetical protein ISR65_17955 [Bacteriovoracaceae bacterium]|nr:hypothetical protein [Bacteriovoracaceae bacterium]
MKLLLLFVSLMLCNITYANIMGISCSGARECHNFIKRTCKQDQICIKANTASFIAMLQNQINNSGEYTDCDSLKSCITHVNASCVRDYKCKKVVWFTSVKVIDLPW